jgi:hypothetical protein
MNIDFNQIRNQHVRIQNNQVEVGNFRLPFGEVFQFDPSIGAVSAGSIAAASGQFLRLIGDCPVQLGMLVFTVIGRRRALNLYFPLIKMLTEPEIDQFYQFVDSIAAHPNFDLKLIGENRGDITAQMPSGIRLLVAGHIAEIFFRRRDILERFLAAPRHIRLYTSARAFEQDGGVGGGDYNPPRQSLQLPLVRLLEGFFGETAGVCPFLHEFGHMLDFFDAGSGKMGQSKGLLPGLSRRDGSIFSPRARRLFLSGKRLELDRYLSRYQGRVKAADPLPIGNPYVFQNDSEFIAGYLEMFFRSPNYFAAQNQDLFAAFMELFGYDPRNAWKQDFPFYVNENRKFYLGQRPANAPHLTIPRDKGWFSWLSL